jgi:hypothetical protein
MSGNTSSPAPAFAALAVRVSQLEAERDAAYARGYAAGAEAMREAAAREVIASAGLFDHPSVYMGGPSNRAKRTAEEVAVIIRECALPIPQEAAE